MNRSEIFKMMKQVQKGELSPEKAVLKLKLQPFEDIDFAKIDCHRELRQGTAEVIYGEGKTPEQISKISDRMLSVRQRTILITRLSKDNAEEVSKTHELKYYEIARIGIIGEIPSPDGLGKIVVATGGTSDMPVAEEAALTAEILGNQVLRLYDVGVAGLHRMFASLEDLMRAKVIIAIAGMEGALASVIGGLVDCPVIAVPTSIGYGASFNGVAALLSMLNSCASGVSVVNIDNGFGAGYIANMINHMEVSK
ncbi:MAG: nickel pincer cofactor biosynthesis protein LarB [Eubacteriales bacterium]